MSIGECVRLHSSIHSGPNRASVCDAVRLPTTAPPGASALPTWRSTGTRRELGHHRMGRDKRTDESGDDSERQRGELVGEERTSVTTRLTSLKEGNEGVISFTGAGYCCSLMHNAVLCERR
jgi:hypothetical protein